MFNFDQWFCRHEWELIREYPWRAIFGATGVDQLWRCKHCLKKRTMEVFD